jgi:hypothetical protein
MYTAPIKAVRIFKNLTCFLFFFPYMLQQSLSADTQHHQLLLVKGSSSRSYCC